MSQLQPVRVNISDDDKAVCICSQLTKYAMSVFVVFFKGVSNRAYVELPVYSKYLIIAAYIASYNPVKSDKRFFSKVDSVQNINV